MNNSNGYTELLCDSLHGIHIPQIMAQRLLENNWLNISPDDVDGCSDPDNESYWYSWDAILDNAEYRDEEGHTWLLWQDGDLWAYRSDMPEELLESFMGVF